MSAKTKEMGYSQNTPDSTTKEKIQFVLGDEVLMERRDGNFYLGTVVEIDHSREQCLVKFGDNTESWSSVTRLTKLSTGFDVACVKCKSSESHKGNDILVCDKCSRGYHQLCHSPEVKGYDGGDNGKWECSRCEELPDKRYLPVRKSSAPLLQIQLPLSAPSPPSNKLPYKLTDLDWDVHHKVNKSDKYCYCGGPGKWFLRMVQCGRCRQWFHSRCITSLQIPVLFGDRFFVFVCSICNSGKEYIRRLEIKWIDLVHLSIFHLTLISSKKYLHVDNDLLKFINSSWDLIQLPTKIRTTAIPDRREFVLTTLTGNRDRFKCCREVAKRTTMWGLRSRVPPPTPVFSVPSTKPLTDQALDDAWAASPRLNFLRLSFRVGKLDSEWDVCEEDRLPGIDILHINNSPLVLPNGVPSNGHNVCIKSSAPRSEIDRRIKSDDSDDGNFRTRKSRKLLRKSMTKSKSGKVGELPPTPPSSESNPEVGVGPCPLDTSGAEDEAPSTLDSFIPPPTDFEGKNNPFLSFPLSLGPTTSLQPTLKPTKRRLSEKDIRVTSNGEVKRRRIRRRKAAPNRFISEPKKVTPTTSPVKSQPAISLEQLKTSVNHFFGAMNRIAAGEKFKVRAKRVSKDGKVQYLLDWGGSALQG